MRILVTTLCRARAGSRAMRPGYRSGGAAPDRSTLSQCYRLQSMRARSRPRRPPMVPSLATSVAMPERSND